MTEHQPPPLAPPTEPGHRGPVAPRTAAWPTVLGILGIMLGALGAVVYLLNAVLMAFFAPWLAGLGGQGDEATTAGLAASAPLQAGLAAVQTAVSLLLLAAGIGLLRRRPGAAPLARAWAVVKIVVTVAAAVVAVAVQRQQFEAEANQAGGMPGAFFTGIIVATFLFTILWGWALPVFMLIWLRLRGSREEIARWGDAGAGA